MGRKGKRKGRCVRRNVQSNVKDDEEPIELRRAPHSFVIHRGKVGLYVGELVRDFRKVMEPFTASSIKVSKKNTVRDFVSIAGLLHVTHFCMFTRTDFGTYLRIARIPRGPTLSFRVHNYTLSRDVISMLKKQFVFIKQFESPPLVIQNGFSGQGMHLKLITTMFQNMFPAINLAKVDLSTVRRCALFNYDPVSKLIDFRHYAIKVVPAGVSKSVKKLFVNRIPNLSQYKDISEYISNPVNVSESEAEDDEKSHVVLPQKLSSRGNIAAGVSAIRVVEIGPRLTLQLLKAESGFLSGDVLYHDYISKSEHEIKVQKEKVKSRQELKEKRRRIQEENVRKKEFMKEKHEKDKIKPNNGIKVKKHEYNEEKEEDDVEWFKKEVGQEPDSGLFDAVPIGNLKRKISHSGMVKRKKLKEAKGSFVQGHSKVKKFSRKSKLKFGKVKK